MSPSGFNGGLIAWLIGLPFIVTIMLTTKKSRIETLVSSQAKFKSGEEIHNHLRYLLLLVNNLGNQINIFF